MNEKYMLIATGWRDSVCEVAQQKGRKRTCHEVWLGERVELIYSWSYRSVHEADFLSA